MSHSSSFSAKFINGLRYRQLKTVSWYYNGAKVLYVWRRLVNLNYNLQKIVYNDQAGSAFLGYLYKMFYKNLVHGDFFSSIPVPNEGMGLSLNFISARKYK